MADVSGTTRSRVLVGAAIVLLALNLRTAVGSLGVVLDPVRDDLEIGPALAGALTTLPVLCFAVFGTFSPAVVRWTGLNRTAFGVLVVAALALLARTVVDSGPAFVALSVIALAAAAIGNVALPALAKQHLPDHVPAVSAAYGAALMAGAATASLTTVPIADATTGWRGGLAAWAVVAAACAVVWIPMLRHDVRPTRGTTTRTGVSLRQVARSPMAWALTAMFSAQSAGAYAQFGWYATMLDDAGLSASTAGTMLGALSAIGIPVSLLLPSLIRRLGTTPVLPWAFSLATAAGWCGVLLAPTTAPLLWSVLLGVGGGAFLWCLTMVGHRTRTVDGTAALSGFVQGVGYGVAALGPFGIGVLHGATGGFEVPLVVLLVDAVLIGVAGTVVVRSGDLEDELERRGPDGGAPRTLEP